MDDESVIKILMVDDSEDDFILTRASFEYGGDFRHTMDWAETIEDGLGKVDAGSYDIFIVDYRLESNMNRTGLDFVNALRIQGVQTPVILLTGMDTEKISKDGCDALNISRCLSKHEKDPNLLISIILDTVLHFSIARKDAS